MPLKSFKGLGLSDFMCEVLKKQGIVTPTPIQLQSIELLHKKTDLLGIAKTGSGKTLAFLLPLLSFLEPKASLQLLILAPTRELAGQIADTAQLFLKAGQVHKSVGGHALEVDKRGLEKHPQLLVATPGRLNDLLEKELLNLSTLSMLVIDEVDRMWDMGFMPAVEKITQKVPKRVQKALFSATFDEKLAPFLKSFCPKCQMVKQADERHEKLSHFYYKSEDKFKSLMALLSSEVYEKSIIFCNTKEQTQRLYKRFKEQGIEAHFFDGSLEQYERDELLIAFKSGAINLLIASDLAARGLDIAGVDLVIEYDIAFKKELYTHRVGRTARQDKEGRAISLVASKELKYLDQLKQAGVAFKPLKLQESIKLNLKAPEYKLLILLKGKKDKIRKADIVGSLCKEAMLKPQSIGTITLTPKRSYIAIKADEAQKALLFFKTQTLKGRRIKALLFT